MDCKEVYRQLNDFADEELVEQDRRLVVEHLSKCEECAKAHEGIVQLKYLIHTSARNISAPERLERAIAEDLTGAGQSGVPRYWWAAAAVLLVGLLLAFYSPFGTSGARAAHAEMLEACVANFAAFGVAERPALIEEKSSAEMEQFILDDIEAKIGLTVEDVPVIPGAAYCGFARYAVPRVESVEGVRLDFVVRGRRSGGAPAEEAPPTAELICVFVIPMASLPVRSALLSELDAKGHLCRCLPGTKNTIYCYATQKILVNVVTHMEKKSFTETYQPVFVR